MGQTRSVKLRYTLPAVADLTAILDYIAARLPQARSGFRPVLRPSPTFCCSTPTSAAARTIPPFVG